MEDDRVIDRVLSRVCGGTDRRALAREWNQRGAGRRSTRVAMAVVDLDLPDIDGIAVCRRCDALARGEQAASSPN